MEDDLLEACDVTGAWFQTHSGRKVDLDDPDPGSFIPLDIAAHLAAIPRFSGAVGAQRHYSVAEHSLLVDYIAREFDEVRKPAHQLRVLLHDAHEMVTSDIPRPVKAVCGTGIRELEDRLDRAIRVAMGLPPEFEAATEARLADEIKRSDLLALRFEREYLMATPPEPWFTDEAVPLLVIPGFPRCWSPQHAFGEFYARLRELMEWSQA